MTEGKPKVKLAYLSDVLYVPTEHVRSEHLDAFTYKFEKIIYEKPDDVVTKCANCKFWKVPWKDHNGTEVLCHLKGYTEKDYCKKFFPKPVKRIEEYEVVTYNQPNSEFYTFGRGDLGKIEKTFQGFEFIDQRSAPKLGIDLKMKEGRVLRPEQVEVVKDWLKHGYGIIKAPTGSGKCISADTLISTNKGLVPIGELIDPLLEEEKTISEGFEYRDISSLGLKVTASGHNAKISTVCRKRSTTLKITTNWGYSIEVSPEHPLLVIKEGQLEWVEAAKLKNEDNLAIRGIILEGEPKEFTNLEHININKNHRKDIGVVLPERMTPSLARLLGALVADGGLTHHITYTKKDLVNVQDVREAVESLGLTLKKDPYYPISYLIQKGGQPFIKFLEHLGLKLVTSKYKTVPVSVLRAGKEIVKHFLRGYFSGDGDVVISSGGIDCCSASFRLIKELQILLLGFNIPSISYVKPVKLETWEGPRDYWKLNISRAFVNKFKEEIGFLPGSNREARLNQSIIDFEGKTFNANEFTLPIHDLIREAYIALGNAKVKHRYKRSLAYKHIWERKIRVNPNTLLNFMNSYPEGEHLPEFKALRDIYNLNVNHSVWFPSITSIEPGEEQWVYDITVPEGHWYVANGIVSHNTVMWTYLVQHIGLRSILLAQEVRHLQVGFEGLYEHTNIAELEKEAGINLCGRLGHDHYFDSSGKAVFKKNKDPGKTYPITFSTYQALDSKKGKELLAGPLKDTFGLVWNEECLVGSTLIPTTKGLIRIDKLVQDNTKNKQELDIKVGSRYGIANTASWLTTGIQPTLKVTTKMNYSYTGTFNHEMMVLNPKTYELIWVKTKDLKPGDLLCISPEKVAREGELELNLPEVEPKSNTGRFKHVIKPTKMTPDLAFIIAFIVAEGSLTEWGFAVTNTEEIFLEKLASCIRKCFDLDSRKRVQYPAGTEIEIKGNKYITNKDCYELAVTSTPVRHWLEYLGVSTEKATKKVIPWSILEADEESQLEFLAGYVEGDGFITARYIGFCSYSEEILNKIQILLQTLGFHSASLASNKEAILLNHKDSLRLYNKFKHRLTFKTMPAKKARDYEKYYSIPAEGIISLLKERKTKESIINFKNEKGVSIRAKGLNYSIITRKNKGFTYGSIEAGRYEILLKLLSKIEPNLYKRVENLIKLRYRFTEVKTITEAGNQLVYDLSMKDTNNRSFIANGLISSNCHHSGAETFHRVAKTFTSYYKGGQSATPTRKDELHCAIYDTIGPITAVGTKEQMVCQYTFISTGVTAPDRLFFGQYPLPKLFTFISTNKDIQECILQWLLHDIQNGRKPLYITERKADAFSLRDKIHMSGYNVELIMGGSEAKKQSDYADRLQDGSLHVILGTKVIKENYNIPPLDTLHLIYPNFGVESEEQMTGRIRRYVLGPDGEPIFKNQPLIRIYTVGANNTIPKKSMEFRKAFYRKMGFEELNLTPQNSTMIEYEKDTISGSFKDEK